MKRKPQTFEEVATLDELVQRSADPHAKAAVKAMLGQLLIALVKRAGGSIEMPVAEIDATGDSILSMRLDQERASFFFETTRKS